MIFTEFRSTGITGMDREKYDIEKTKMGDVIKEEPLDVNESEEDSNDIMDATSFSAVDNPCKEEQEELINLPEAVFIKSEVEYGDDDDDDDNNEEEEAETSMHEDSLFGTHDTSESEDRLHIATQNYFWEMGKVTSMSNNSPEIHKDPEESIPKKSKELYKKEYEKFCAWRNENCANETNETAVLAYLTEQSKVFKPSSLWCMFSKIKAILKVKGNANITSFNKVSDFLKKNSVGFEAKKLVVLSRLQVDEFLLKAPDDVYLLMKVVSIFGIFGGCRRHELHNLCIDDVESKGEILVIHIREKKDSTSRTFTISSDGPVNYVQLIQKYVSLRPKNVTCKNLFLYYRSYKCSCQPIGINTFGKIPKEIATFLKLPNPAQYTGNSFRISSSSTLSNSEAYINAFEEQFSNPSQYSGHSFTQNPHSTITGTGTNITAVREQFQNSSQYFGQRFSQNSNSIIADCGTSSEVVEEQLPNKSQFMGSSYGSSSVRTLAKSGSNITADCEGIAVAKSGVENALESMEIAESITALEQPLLIPEKSKELYKREYEKFCSWRCEQNAKETNESILLTYLSEQSKVFKPSSLWCIYSKLKATVKVKENVNLASFTKVTDFLKKTSAGYETKKAVFFSRLQIEEFLLKAPDDIYLLMKVVAVLGIFGACKRQELHDLCINDVKMEGSILVIRIHDTKYNKSRTITILPDGPVSYVEFYKKYVALRPAQVTCKNLFLYYRNNKCSCQPVGINTFGKIPKEIAKFLKLPNPSQYTGHSFRRSSTSIISNCGASSASIKQLDPKSVTVGETCTDEVMGNKIERGENVTVEEQSLLIPIKSKELYEREYEKFCAWRKEKKAIETNKTVMLDYLTEQSKFFKPSSLWCIYSKLKTTLKVKENVNLALYTEVTDFLKNISVGYEAKKSYATLSRSQIEEFLLKAPDDKYLLMKVVAIFCIFGACRRHELHDLCINDVKMEGSILVIRIRETKFSTSRNFTILSDGPVNYIELYKKYVALRPSRVTCKNLFLYFRNNKCSCQPVGINNFGKIPKEIAKFLKLPNPSQYTGHSFRRSPTSIISISGPSIASVKHLGDL